MQKRCFCAVVLASLIGSQSLLAAPKAREDAGVGFFMSSEDFGDPCTQNVGNAPVVYDNATAYDVDVSVKVVNTGSSILLIEGTGFAIPPDGPMRRPRIMRITLEPGAGLKIRAQTPDCSWTAIVQPH